MNDLKKSSLADTISFFTLLGTIALLPIFTLPIFGMPSEISKGFFLAFGAFASLLSWIVGRFVDKEFTIPKSLLIPAVFALPALFLISAFVSGNIPVSFWGNVFDIGSVITMIVFSVLFFLSAIFFQNKKNILYLAISILGSFSAVLLFQTLHLFFNFSIFHGFFFQSTANLVGKWNDLGIFFGLTALLSLFAIEFLSIAKNFKRFFIFSLVASMFFVTLVNFMAVWIVLALMALLLFIYSVSSKKEIKNKDEKKKTFPAASFVIIIFCLIFILGNSFVGIFLPSHFNVVSLEVRPSFISTMNVTKGVLSNHLFFGSGPNKFASSWSLFKSQDVNTTRFWNTDFDLGFGLLPTFFATCGILGGLGFVFFLFLLVYRFLKSKILSIKDESKYFIISSFIAAIYLWMFTVVYVPNIAMFALAFVFSGVFLGTLVNKKIVGSYVISFSNDRRKSFILIPVLVLLTAGAVSGEYFSIKKFASAVYFNKAISAMNQTSLSLASVENNLIQSLSLSPNDMYYRTLSEVYVAEARDILSQKNISIETVKPEIEKILGNAQSSAILAIQYDRTNYSNWIAFGKFYQNVLALGLPKAYDNSKKSYQKALELNPHSPSIYLSLANLELDNKNEDAAKNYANSALKEKPDYTDAMFLLAKIAEGKNDLAEAILQIQKASLIDPYNIDIFFNLGLLKYNSADYAGAIPAFERAVYLNKDNLNSRYFLGLSYDKAGRKSDAIAQFEYIALKNPDNQDIKNILDNLNAGREAMESTPAPKKKK